MTVYLVRHAAAVRRSAWGGPGPLRPLAAGGHRQAQRLAEFLARAPVGRVLASPHLRCRQTLEPLAARRGLPLETDRRLSEGVGVGGALELLASSGADDVVLCTHGELIATLIETLCARGLALPHELVCGKGSIWILEGDPWAPESASYVPPPAKSRRREAAAGNDALGPAEPDRAAGKLRVAVFDLGSTSFHLLVADTAPSGEIHRVLRERTMLRLGAAIVERGRIPGKVGRRAVETARALRRHADRAEADLLLPVATSALRDAENGPDLVKQLGEALGVPVRILSGEQEARLIAAAFRRRVPLPPGPHLGLDLGGGSLELALGDDQEDVRWEATLRLGAARLHRELVTRDPMGRKAERAIRGRVRDLLAPFRPEVACSAPRLCVATGGTVSALARLVVARRSSWPVRTVSQLFLPRQELAAVARDLMVSTHDERLLTPGMSKQRADILPTGAAILDEATAQLGLDGLTVSDWGLREGVILEALGLADASDGAHPGGAR
jgi:exopolyphosphatase/guanosine-5'-triphosphate,3'-diphosphate pyrophosphatase